MTKPTNNAQDGETYRVYLLRIWRHHDGPWHATLQAADAVAPQRFADLDALAECIRTATFINGAGDASDASERD